ncbi:MAG: fumarylacetoacetate hydrolase family protein [Sphingomonadaceae bacterium]|nr:fumarylacetoacetate hydrolase family protein [Sphingomonadaceae bacterium]
MQFASYRFVGRPGFGLVQGERVIDLGATGGPASLRQAIASGALASLARRGGAELALAEVELLPVIPDPAKLFCVGLNYELHRQETGRTAVGHPTIFTRFADTLAAAGQPIVRPRVSAMLDYEGELAVIVGRGGRHIAQADALTHVAGYACFNDASVRDWQNHTHQYTPGKNFPATAPFGPTLVTPDEVGELGPQRITTRLNGRTVQDAHLGDMIFPVPVVIAYLSTFTPLAPGDVIAMGTPGGVGFKRDPQLFMQPGDTVEVEIERVGLLRSTVVAEA